MLTSFIKDTKTANEINKRREEASNLFGLGLVSLIAACSSDGLNASTSNDIPIDDDTTTMDDDTTTMDDDTTTIDDDTTTMDDDTTTMDDDVVDTPDPLPFAALAVSDLSMAESGLMAAAKGDTNSFVVELSDSAGTIKTLSFAKGKLDADNKAQIYQLTDTEDQYDLVISSLRIDKTSGVDYEEGKIFIYWDAANVVDETSLHLEITGAKNREHIGIHAPEFLQLGGVADENKLDMVIRSHRIDHNVDVSVNPDEGGIYILWDIADYQKAATVNQIISLDSNASATGEATGATFGSLAIYGGTPADVIGTYAPDFLQLGAKEDTYDMVIRSHLADKSNVGIRTEAGAIFVLWDVADYYNTASLHHTIVLDSSANAAGEATGATLGSLTIYGAKEGDNIGTYAPDFLQLGGVADDNKLDMVIRGGYIDKFGAGSTVQTNEGVIFVLWDVADYYNTASLHHTINLDASVTDATSGSLTIYGGRKYDHIGASAPEFLHIGGKDDNYDMVIREKDVDKSGDGAITNEGAIYILWDVADYYNTDTASLHHTITLDSNVTGEAIGATSGSLTIYGAKSGDNIGEYAPEFLQIGGKDDNHDMIIRGRYVDTLGPGGTTNNEGAIFVLWDVADYHNTATVNHTITLDSSATATGEATGATSGSLAIYGARNYDHIGASAPEFLHIGGKDDNYDMVIRERDADKSGAGAAAEEGAIYILWDVEDYHNADTASLHHTITLDSNVTGIGEATGATSGSLTIYGGKPSDIIGVDAPEFLHIGGKDDNYDMVIRSAGVDKFGVGAETNEGAIYILWDVEDYYSVDPASLNYTVTLDASATGATSGSLAIHGARNYDYVGGYDTEFLQLGGKDDNYDMVIRSAGVDKVSTRNDEGAIYVLWDVEDYYSTDPADANKAIDLLSATDATSGLLTIYGKATGENLGSDANNVLYGSDNDGNKVLTNIDGDAAGTKDIAFRDKDYTYILFGDKVAATGGDTEVDSKTIDLAKVVIATDENNADGNFFSYDFDESTPYTVTARVGYRFATGTGSDGEAGYTTLAEVQDAYDLVNPSYLSDKDADLGVWDIA